MREFTEQHVQALFFLAGIKINKIHKLENKYWPDHQNYADIRKTSPWWLVDTPYGLIEVGWRKRVMSIDWSDTEVEFTVPDDVTKSPSMCHAWSYGKAVDYLAVLHQRLRHAGPETPNDA